MDLHFIGQEDQDSAAKRRMKKFEEKFIQRDTEVNPFKPSINKNTKSIKALFSSEPIYERLNKKGKEYNEIAKT